MDLMPESNNSFNKLLMPWTSTKKEKAVLDLESAKDHCDRIDNEYEISLEAVDKQLDYLN